MSKKKREFKEYKMERRDLRKRGHFRKREISRGS